MSVGYVISFFSFLWDMMGMIFSVGDRLFMIFGFLWAYWHLCITMNAPASRPTRPQTLDAGAPTSNLLQNIYKQSKVGKEFFAVLCLGHASLWTLHVQSFALDSARTKLRFGFLHFREWRWRTTRHQVIRSPNQRSHHFRQWYFIAYKWYDHQTSDCIIFVSGSN